MIFERVLVGNDGSPAAIQALQLARRLQTPAGELVALTFAEVHFAGRTGLQASEWDRRIRNEADVARLAAERVLRDDPGATARVVTGHADVGLLRAIDECHADLVAVGSHGGSRMTGILLGSVATRLIHDAQCAVLVGKGEPDVETFPRSIVVGIDGSPESFEAAAVSEAIAGSADACLRRLTAAGGKRVPADEIPGTEIDTRSPVDALVDASHSSDLVVVGSRGVHGVAALGSVAERVAHDAMCPVLILRRTTHSDSGFRGMATALHASMLDV